MNLQESMTGFYYVGTKRANITKLVNIYKRGYASGNLKEAGADITKQEFCKPEVICCEAGLGFFSIRKWASQLAKDDTLSNVPLLIVSEKWEGIEKIRVSMSRKIDGVLNFSTWEENDLQTKILLLKKNKERLQNLNNQETFKRRNDKMNGILKRSFDLFLSSLFLLLLSPVLLLIATAIRFETKGNVMNHTRRIGRNYRMFNFYTFRTEGSRVGEFIRTTGLEELPMLMNILRGDVSLMESKDDTDNYIMINLE